MFKVFSSKPFLSLSTSPAFNFSNTLNTASILNCSSLDLYQTVLDVNQYHKFVPACIKSQVTHRVNDSEFYGRLTADFKLYQDSYISQVIHHQNDFGYKVISISRDNQTFKYLKGVWDIKNINESSCRVNYSLTYEFNSILYQHAANMFINTLSQLTLDSFEKRTLANIKARKQAEASNLVTADPGNTKECPVGMIMTRFLKPRKMGNGIELSNEELKQQNQILDRLTLLRLQGKLCDYNFYKLSEYFVRNMSLSGQLKHLFQLESENILNEITLLKHLNEFIVDQDVSAKSF